MWFKLASATFSTHLGPMSKLSNSISIKYNTSGFSYTTGSVSKDDASASLVLTLNSNYTYEHNNSNVTITGATKGTTSYSNGTLTIPITPSSGSTFGASGVSSINVTVTGAVSSGGKPENPVNYTFTLNPTPTSATVTLSATGYSNVSGTGSKSITVANGTKVNWTVSASGYTTRTGSWTISGGNKTEDIVLTTTGGGDSPKETTWYVDYTTLGGNFNFGYTSGAVTFADATTYSKCVGVPINALKVIPGGAGSIGYGKVASDGDTYTPLGIIEIPEADVAASGTADAAKVYELNETITLAAGERIAVMEYKASNAGKIYVSTSASEKLAKARTNIRSAGASKDENWKLSIGIGYIA